jgi:hypothetical protein
MMIAPMNPRCVLRLAAQQKQQFGDAVFDADQASRRSDQKNIVSWPMRGRV